MWLACVQHNASTMLKKCRGDIKYNVINSIETFFLIRPPLYAHEYIYDTIHFQKILFLDLPIDKKNNLCYI